MQNLNVVAITGNLTRDPDLRYLAEGDKFVCTLRVAVSGWRKDPENGEWTERAMYFDVAVWGRRAETVATYLTKGRGVAVSGRLDWREWTDEAGARHERVGILADTVQFLGARPRTEEAVEQ
jgi:single-strand DNA-binding protein